MTRIRRSLEGGLLLLAFVIAAPALAQRLELPDWRVGDRWSYRHATIPGDSSQPQSVRSRTETIVASSKAGFELSALEERGSRSTETTIRWTADGSIVSQQVRGQPILRFQPPTQFVHWPAEPGQRWSTAFDMVADDGRRLARVQSSSTAISWESISVPAGTFRALRVEAEFTRSDTRRFSRLVFWFAAEVKRRVKTEERIYDDGRLVSTQVIELVSFTPGR
jgi:hypothetical protein